MNSLPTIIICSICNEEYVRNISYCDESFECAMDDGESLVRVG